MYTTLHCTASTLNWDLPNTVYSRTVLHTRTHKNVNGKVLHTGSINACSVAPGALCCYWKE